MTSDIAEFGVAFGIIGLLILLVYCEVNRDKWEKQDREKRENESWRKVIRFYKGDKNWWRDET